MSYFAREEVFTDPELLARVMEILQGKLRLDWMGLEVERVRCRPSHPARGLTYDDTNVGSYGWDVMPEKIRHNFSMASRGSYLPPGLPDVGYTINRKSEVWSDRAPALYEEAKSRHWAPARRVPWGALSEAPYSEDQEKALGQLYTGLSSMAMALQDIPMRWVWKINQELIELKSFLCAQTFDAAQMADTFRKRAIAGGQGLGRDLVNLEILLKGVIDAGTYPCASGSANLLLAGVVQAMLRHVASVAGNPADQTILKLAVQDVSRSLAYGVDHLRSLTRARPHEASSVAGHLAEVEGLAVGFLGSPEWVAALALATGGSREAAPAAVPRVARLYATLAREHGERCAAAGLGADRGDGPLAILAREMGAGR